MLVDLSVEWLRHYSATSKSVGQDDIAANDSNSSTHQTFHLDQAQLPRVSKGLSPMNVTWVPSPNFAAREPDCVVDTIVVHATVLETVEIVIEHFQKEVPGVSAHYTIERDGRICQHVDESMLAFHAGVSLMPDGRDAVNRFSIGIELVNRNDGIDPYPEKQLRALDDLVSGLKERHTIRHLVGHWEIAVPAGRKTDPQGLDLEALRAKLALSR